MTEVDELLETVVGLPPNGWTLGHATIHLRSGKKAIEAMRRGAWAVHEVKRVGSGNGWRLSHAPTGLQIWTFDLLEQAIELAERIEPLTAWGEITKMLPSGDELFPKVRAVIDQIESAPHMARE